MNKLKTVVRRERSSGVGETEGMERTPREVAKSCQIRNFGMYCLSVEWADCDVMISLNVSVRASASSEVADVAMARIEAASRGATPILSALINVVWSVCVCVELA